DDRTGQMERVFPRGRRDEDRLVPARFGLPRRDGEVAVLSPEDDLRLERGFEALDGFAALGHVDLEAAAVTDVYRLADEADLEVEARDRPLLVSEDLQREGQGEGGGRGGRGEPDAEAPGSWSSRGHGDSWVAGPAGWRPGPDGWPRPAGRTSTRARIRRASGRAAGRDRRRVELHAVRGPTWRRRTPIAGRGLRRSVVAAGRA